MSGASTAVIVGLPNSGKTSLYNELTGGYALVANYPMTTVEIQRTECLLDGRKWTVVDTPGLHGLFIQSEEEVQVRDLLFRQAPDVLVQCVDADRLAQSLTLTADLMELGLPMALYVIGKRIDTAALEKALGVPVVASPKPGAGHEEMKAAMRRLVDGGAPTGPMPRYREDLVAAVEKIAGTLPPALPCRRKAALLLAEGDRTFQVFLAGTAGKVEARRIGEEVRAQCAALAGAVPQLIAEPKNLWVEAMAARAAVPVRADAGRTAERLAAICRDPLMGLPVLAAFLVLLYLSIVYVAGFLSTFLAAAVTEPLVALSSGLLPDGFWQDLLVGPYGLLTLGLFNALGTVLPVLSVFFLLFGLLEDCGYLPNLAVLTRRVLAKIGIGGNSVIPLMLGFGCKTMATLMARGVPSRKEKLIVVFLIAFAIPCSGQMGLAIAVLGRFGPAHLLIAFGFLVLAATLAGVLLNLILPADGGSSFIQELPPLRVPRPLEVLSKTGHRLLWFLREAIPLFLIASLLMFALDKSGVLNVLHGLLEPAMTGWLGLPVEMVDALLLALARQEAAVGLILKMCLAGLLTGVQGIVAVTVVVLFIPCLANIAAIFREVGWKAGSAMLLSKMTAAFLLAGGLNALLRLLQGALKP